MKYHNLVIVAICIVLHFALVSGQETTTNEPLPADEQSTTIDCNGKSFYCLDNNRYRMCTEMVGGAWQTGENTVQNCATGTYCLNDGLYACSSNVSDTFDVVAETESYGTVTDTIEEDAGTEATVVYEANTATVLPTNTVGGTDNLPAETTVGQVTESTANKSPSTSGPTEASTSGPKIEATSQLVTTTGSPAETSSLPDATTMISDQHLTTLEIIGTDKGQEATTEDSAVTEAEIATEDQNTVPSDVKVNSIDQGISEISETTMNTNVDEKLTTQAVIENNVGPTEAQLSNDFQENASAQVTEDSPVETTAGSDIAEGYTSDILSSVLTTMSPNSNADAVSVDSEKQLNSATIENDNVDAGIQPATSPPGLAPMSSETEYPIENSVSQLEPEKDITTQSTGDSLIAEDTSDQSGILTTISPNSNAEPISLDLEQQLNGAATVNTNADAEIPIQPSTPSPEFTPLNGETGNPIQNSVSQSEADKGITTQATVDSTGGSPTTEGDASNISLPNSNAEPNSLDSESQLNSAATINSNADTEISTQPSQLPLGLTTMNSNTENPIPNSVGQSEPDKDITTESPSDSIGSSPANEGDTSDLSVNILNTISPNINAEPINEDSESQPNSAATVIANAENESSTQSAGTPQELEPIDTETALPSQNNAVQPIPQEEITTQATEDITTSPTSITNNADTKLSTESAISATEKPTETNAAVSDDSPAETTARPFTVEGFISDLLSSIRTTISPSSYTEPAKQESQPNSETTVGNTAVEELTTQSAIGLPETIDSESVKPIENMVQQPNSETTVSTNADNELAAQSETTDSDPMNISDVGESVEPIQNGALQPNVENAEELSTQLTDQQEPIGSETAKPIEQSLLQPTIETSMSTNAVDKELATPSGISQAGSIDNEAIGVPQSAITQPDSIDNSAVAQTDSSNIEVENSSTDPDVLAGIDTGTSQQSLTADDNTVEPVLNEAINSDPSASIPKQPIGTDSSSLADNESTASGTTVSPSGESDPNSEKDFGDATMANESLTQQTTSLNSDKDPSATMEGATASIPEQSTDAVKLESGTDAESTTANNPIENDKISVNGISSSGATTDPNNDGSISSDSSANVPEQSVGSDLENGSGANEIMPISDLGLVAEHPQTEGPESPTDEAIATTESTRPGPGMIAISETNYLPEQESPSGSAPVAQQSIEQPVSTNSNDVPTSVSNQAIDMEPVDSDNINLESAGTTESDPTQAIPGSGSESLSNIKDEPSDATEIELPVDALHQSGVGPAENSLTESNQVQGSATTGNVAQQTTQDSIQTDGEPQIVDEAEPDSPTATEHPADEIQTAATGTDSYGNESISPDVQIAESGAQESTQTEDGTTSDPNSLTDQALQPDSESGPNTELGSTGAQLDHLVLPVSGTILEPSQAGASTSGQSAQAASDISVNSENGNPSITSDPNPSTDPSGQAATAAFDQSTHPPTQDTGEGNSETQSESLQPADQNSSPKDPSTEDPEIGPLDAHLDPSALSENQVAGQAGSETEESSQTVQGTESGPNDLPVQEKPGISLPDDGGLGDDQIKPIELSPGEAGSLTEINQVSDIDGLQETAQGGSQNVAPSTTSLPDQTVQGEGIVNTDSQTSQDAGEVENGTQIDVQEIGSGGTEIKDPSAAASDPSTSETSQDAGMGESGTQTDVQQIGSGGTEIKDPIATEPESPATAQTNQGAVTIPFSNNAGSSANLDAQTETNNGLSIEGQTSQENGLPSDNPTAESVVNQNSLPADNSLNSLNQGGQAVINEASDATATGQTAQPNLGEIGLTSESQSPQWSESSGAQISPTVSPSQPSGEAGNNPPSSTNQDIESQPSLTGADSQPSTIAQENNANAEDQASEIVPIDGSQTQGTQFPVRPQVPAVTIDPFQADSAVTNNPISISSDTSAGNKPEPQAIINESGSIQSESASNVENGLGEASSQIPSTQTAQQGNPEVDGIAQGSSTVITAEGNEIENKPSDGAESSFLPQGQGMGSQGTTIAHGQLVSANGASESQVVIGENQNSELSASESASSQGTTGETPVNQPMGNDVQGGAALSQPGSVQTGGTPESQNLTPNEQSVGEVGADGNKEVQSAAETEQGQADLGGEPTASDLPVSQTIESGTQDGEALSQSSISSGDPLIDTQISQNTYEDTELMSAGQNVGQTAVVPGTTGSESFGGDTPSQTGPIISSGNPSTDSQTSQIGNEGTVPMDADQNVGQSGASISGSQTTGSESQGGNTPSQTGPLISSGNPSIDSQTPQIANEGTEPSANQNVGQTGAGVPGSQTTESESLGGDTPSQTDPNISSDNPSNDIQTLQLANEGTGPMGSDQNVSQSGASVPGSQATGSEFQGGNTPSQAGPGIGSDNPPIDNQISQMVNEGTGPMGASQNVGQTGASVPGGQTSGSESLIGNTPSSDSPPIANNENGSVSTDPNVDQTAASVTGSQTIESESEAGELSSQTSHAISSGYPSIDSQTSQIANEGQEPTGADQNAGQTGASVSGSQTTGSESQGGNTSSQTDPVIGSVSPSTDSQTSQIAIEGPEPTGADPNAGQSGASILGSQTSGSESLGGNTPSQTGPGISSDNPPIDNQVSQMVNEGTGPMGADQNVGQTGASVPSNQTTENESLGDTPSQIGPVISSGNPSINSQTTQITNEGTNPTGASVPGSQTIGSESEASEISSQSGTVIGIGNPSIDSQTSQNASVGTGPLGTETQNSIINDPNLGQIGASEFEIPGVQSGADGQASLSQVAPPSAGLSVNQPQEDNVLSQTSSAPSSIVIETIPNAAGATGSQDPTEIVPPVNESETNNNGTGSQGGDVFQTGPNASNGNPSIDGESSQDANEGTASVQISSLGNPTADGQSAAQTGATGSEIVGNDVVNGSDTDSDGQMTQNANEETGLANDQSVSQTGTSALETDGNSVQSGTNTEYTVSSQETPAAADLAVSQPIENESQAASVLGQTSTDTNNAANLQGPSIDSPTSQNTNEETGPIENEPQNPATDLSQQNTENAQSGQGLADVPTQPVSVPSEGGSPSVSGTETLQKPIPGGSVDQASALYQSTNGANLQGQVVNEVSAGETSPSLTILTEPPVSATGEEAGVQIGIQNGTTGNENVLNNISGSTGKPSQTNSATTSAQKTSQEIIEQSGWSIQAPSESELHSATIYPSISHQSTTNGVGVVITSESPDDNPDVQDVPTDQSDESDENGPNPSLPALETESNESNEDANDQNAAPINNTPLSPPTPNQFVCLNSGRYPDPYDCSKYHVCLNSKSGYYNWNRTCTDGTVFSRASLRCVDDRTQCTVAGAAPFTCFRSGRYPDLGDPQKYYLCVSNSKNVFRKFHLKCAEDSEFSVRHNRCNRIQTRNSHKHTDRRSTEENRNEASASATETNKQEPHREHVQHPTHRDNRQRNEHRKHSPEESDNNDAREVNNVSQPHVQHSRHHNNHNDRSREEHRKHSSEEINTNDDEEVTRKHKQNPRQRNDNEDKDNNDSSEEIEFKCVEEGRFADPKDDQKFYYCTQRNKTKNKFRKKHFRCDKEHRFDADDGKCVKKD